MTVITMLFLKAVHQDLGLPGVLAFGRAATLSRCWLAVGDLGLTVYPLNVRWLKEGERDHVLLASFEHHSLTVERYGRKENKLKPRKTRVSYNRTARSAGLHGNAGLGLFIVL